MDIIIVKHTTENKDSHNPNTLLTVEGRREAQELAQTLKSYAPTQILTSDMLRTMETATILASVLGIPVQFDNSFRDPRNFVNGVVVRPANDSTTFETLQRDAFSGISELLYGYEKSGDKIVVVTHRTVITAIRAYFEEDCYTNEELEAFIRRNYDRLAKPFIVRGKDPLPDEYEDLREIYDIVEI